MNHIITFYICIFMILTVNADYLTASLRKQTNQKTLLVHDLEMCLKHNAFSLVQRYENIVDCIKKQLLKCIFKYSEDSLSTVSSVAKFTETPSAYCGVILEHGGDNYDLRTNILAGVGDGHSIHFSILHFKIPLSIYEHCSENGIKFVSLEFESETYCGFRLPWTLIIQNHQVVIHMNLVNYKTYSVQIFYSSFYANWIDNISEVHTFRTSYSAFPIDLTRPFYARYRYAFKVPIINYCYILITEPFTNIHIYIPDIEISHVDLSIYDGPGLLSRTIYNLRETHSIKSNVIRSSAFVAFIKIKLTDLTPVRLKFNTAPRGHNIGKLPICRTSIHRGIIRSESMKTRNVACSYTLPKRHQTYYDIFVKTFSFSGPNKMTSLNPSVCQYGGLVIYFTGKQRFEFCENVYDLHIYGDVKPVTLMFTWFSGYSYGRLSADIKYTPCRTTYAELLPINSQFLIKEDYLTYCNRYICSSSKQNIEKRCIIKLGPPSLGTAKIQMMEEDTLSSCHSTYSNISRDRRITLKTITLDNWPFDFRASEFYYWNQNVSNAVKTFDYLQNATITLPQLCHSSRKQLSAVVVVSTCEVKSLWRENLIINHIPALSESCFNFNYDYQPSTKKSVTEGKYHDFFYRDSGLVNNGSLVRIIYTECPVQCRNYKYKTLVRSVNTTTIYEYTSYVGDFTFTGSYHRGFRVSMIHSNTSCKEYMKCSMRLNVLRPFASYKGEDVMVDEDSEFIFHESR